MTRVFLSLLILCGALRAPAATVEAFGAEPMTGSVEMDSGGILFRPTQGPALKLDFNNLYRVQFDGAGAEEYVPGVVLRDGSRLPAPFSSPNEPTIRFSKRNLSVASTEVAWIVYGRFAASLAANAPAGQTGALLPGGDFFSGTVRGADAEAVKISNPIFGPRRFDARRDEVLAAVLQPVRPVASQYEIRGTDGGSYAVENFGLDRSGVTLRHALYDGLKLAPTEVAEIRAGTNRCRALATLPQLHAEPSTGLKIAADGVLTTDLHTVTTCAVPPGFTEFVIRVAAGNETPAGQRLIFTIYANGNPVGRSAALAAGVPPQPLRIALNGARGIVLRVEAEGAGPATSASGRWIQGFFLRRQISGF